MINSATRSAIPLLFYATCSFASMASPFLANYVPLDVIGKGSFGIIRKARRKTNGLVRVIGSAFLFPLGSRLFLADIRAQKTQL